jgi:hypothetical protein
MAKRAVPERASSAWRAFPKKACVKSSKARASKHRLQPARARGAGEPAARTQPRLHGRAQVRRCGKRSIYLGDERARSLHGADAFRDSRSVVFSTACVYPFADVKGPRRGRRHAGAAATG